MCRLIAAMAFVGVTAVACTVVSCRQVLGLDASPSTDVDAGSDAGAANVCELPYGTSACAACAAANCCEESSACGADKVCADYESCNAACNGDMECRARCIIDHPTGTASDVSALSACIAAHCEDDCNLPCGALAGYAVEPDAAAACASCYTVNGCNEARTCASSASCDALNRCANARTTVDSVEACELLGGIDPTYAWEPDAGDDVYDPFTKVHNGTCATPCANGGYWECVGNVSWPVPQASTTTVHLTVRDFTSLSPASGVTVSVCGLDPMCSQPLVTDTTNSAGLVSLPSPNTAMGGGPAAPGLNGFLQITSPSTIPQLLYWGFPLSQGQAFFYDNTLTPDQLRQFLTGLKVTQDESRGTVVVFAYDCHVETAAGVEITLTGADAQTRAFTGTGAETNITDQGGYLLFANVPAGPIEAIETPMAIGKPSGKTAASVVAGAMTVVLLYPTPL